MEREYRKIKLACYSGSATMAVVGVMPSLLFTTFRDLYGISYSLLGSLVVFFFFTQLLIDVVFSLFSHKFNIQKTVRLMPIITIIGLVIFAVYPMLFPNSAYVGLVIGMVIFAVSAGLAEVLISPIIAEIPAKNPDHEMSKLHSMYAWCSVFVVIISTLFILVFNGKNWHYLVLLIAIVPLLSFIFFMRANIPNLKTTESSLGALKMLKNKQVWLMFIAIFLGGATECTMAQWSSSFIERALQINKVWGDLFGVALFSIMLGLGRSLYAKYGKNIEKMLAICGALSIVCYLTAALINVPVIGLMACALTGLTSSLMWPGSLTVAEKRVPYGVFIYAFMAAGGDMGASLGPQAIGIAVDFVSENFTSLAQTLNLTAEQLGMKAGMLLGAIFPILAFIVYLIIYKTTNKKPNN
ncbi:MAG: MFS transporter [Clostridia bacterium]|nr:MFS transporter [Clostridia bacterium]